jgi:hypothetical protein
MVISTDLIPIATDDIEAYFVKADQIIRLGGDPWQELSNICHLDTMRRRFICEAAEDGVSVLMLSALSKLNPRAVRTILRDERR